MNEQDLESWHGTYSLPADKLCKDLGINLLLKVSKETVSRATFCQHEACTYQELYDITKQKLKEKGCKALWLVSIYKIGGSIQILDGITTKQDPYLYIVCSGEYA